MTTTMPDHGGLPQEESDRPWTDPALPVADRVEALLRGEALAQDVLGILDLAAAGAGQVALEKRLEHEHKRIALVAGEALLQDIGCNRPHL